MLKGYKTELKPNNKQRTKLAKNAGTARFAYNWALDRVENKVSKPNAIELQKEWDAWKKENIDWWSESSKCSPQSAIRDLEQAFKNFFRNCKQKKKGKKGFPKKKNKKSSKNSFRLYGIIKVNETLIQLPRIGKVRLKEHGYIPTDAKIISATISEKAGRWFVSVLIDEEPPAYIIKPESIVGVDLGIKTLATCSDGQIFNNPKALKKNAEKLKRLQRQLSRKVKGSKNRKKARKKLAKQHFRITCIRKDASHKLTSTLTKAKSVIVIEDLNVAGMMKNHKLAGAISDCNWGEIRRQLEYKGKWYDCEIVVADRFFPSSKLCCCCGWKNENLKLSDRLFICQECGLEIDRDANASCNLENYYTASSAGINAFGEVSSGLVAKSSETDFVELGKKQEVAILS